MRTSVKVGAAVAGAALVAASAAAPASAKSPWTKTGASIVGTAVAVSGPDAGTPDSNSGDFDLLITALVGTGAVNLFDGTEYTVFAPTDQAFINLADALSPDSITTEAQAAAFWGGVLSTPEGKALVTRVLAYHVVAGTTPAASVTTGRAITTLEGESFRFSGGKLVGVNSSAGIVTANLKTTDGAIHVIDTVLLPTLG